jgi:hypothetical protein
MVFLGLIMICDEPAKWLHLHALKETCDAQFIFMRPPGVLFSWLMILQHHFSQRSWMYNKVMK